MCLAEAINDENFVSREGKSKFQLWQVLCDLLVKNPTKITSLDADAIIRQGISRYTDQVRIILFQGLILFHNCFTFLLHFLGWHSLDLLGRFLHQKR